MAAVPAISIGGFNNARGALVNPNVPTPSGAGAFGALASGFDQLAELERINNARRDALRSVEVEGEFERSTDEALAELNPLDADYSDQVREIYRQASEDAAVTADFVTPQAEADLAINLTARSEGAITAAQLLRRETLEKEALRLLRVAQDDVFAKIRQDPDGTAAYLAEFARKAGKVNESISPELLPALAEAFADQALIAQAEGLAQAGRFDEARALLDENQGELTPQIFRNAKGRIRTIENDLRADQNAATDGIVADLEIKILKTVTAGGDLDEMEKEVEAAKTAGLFENREQTRVRLVRMIERARRAQQQNLADRLAVQQKLLTGEGLATKKEATLAWDMAVEQLDPEVSVDEVLDRAALFAAETGWLPPRLAQQIKNAERVEDPTLLAAGAQVYDRIVERAPEAVGVAEIGPRVGLTSAIVERIPGSTYESAADLVQTKLPDEQELVRRRAQFTIDFEDLDSFDAIRSIDGFGGGFFGDDVVISQRVADTYESTLRLLYDMHGQADIAQKAAERIFQQRFSVSEVGGVEHVVEFAPERHLPGAANHHLAREQKTPVINDLVLDWIEDQGIEIPPSVIGAEGSGKPVIPGGVSEDLLAAIGGPRQSNIVDTSGIPAFTLIADDRTKRDIQQGLPPTWEVRVRNTFGVLVPPFVGPEANRFRMPSIEALQETPVYQGIVRGVDEGRAARKAQQQRREEKINRKQKAVPKGDRPPEETGMRSPPPGRLGPGDFVPENDDDIGNISRAPQAKPHFQATQFVGINPAMAGTRSRGIRNNNPGNIDRTRIKWEGMAAKQGDKRFITFTTPEMGIRALARVLTTYQRKHGLLTIRGMISRWAPPSENNTDAYVASVAAQTGFDPDRGINLQQDNTMLRLMKALILHENGDQPYDDATLARGIRLSR